MNKTKVIEELLNPGVIAILRGNSAKGLLEAAAALVEGGVRAVEVTLTTPDALAAIREIKRELGEKILMGVGSVLHPQQAQEAVEAGACYVITPVFRPSVIDFCNRNEVPICSGAYSPTEIYESWELGADFVKVFPADGLGISYIKAILAPMPQLPLIPTGGVDEKNCGSFMAAGCKAVAVGGSLVNQAILDEKDWAKITSRAERMVKAVRETRG